MDLPDDLRFRSMTRGDLDRVMEIESGSRPGAWARKDFWSKLNDPRVRGTVMEVERDLCGFSIVAIDGLCCQLMNMAIAPTWRRQGLGSAFLAHLENFSREKALTELRLAIRESNLEAQLFYKKSGFKAVDILHGHFGGEDAYAMRKSIQFES